MRLFVLAIACAGVAAHSPSVAQQPAQPTPLQVMISACDLSTRPELQVLDGKFPLSLHQVHQPGLSLLSTDRSPSGDEQAALAIYDQLHRSCVRAEANWCNDATLGTMPEICAAQQKMFSSEQNHLAALYQGKETFSQYTRSVNALHVDFQSDMTRMIQSAYDKTQQQMQQMRAAPPVQTNCQAYYDGSVRCTTQ